MICDVQTKIVELIVVDFFKDCLNVPQSSFRGFLNSRPVFECWRLVWVCRRRGPLSLKFVGDGGPPVRFALPVTGDQACSSTRQLLY